ncbi:unnamed protein product [Soboliphyme baturini]|uniref:Tumor protein p53-inducible protein 11 n=1 Tax=Soboliphyme baturini TaxID=241478 RepID=A0A183ISG5_9BILA|nr:unnamed protein product [Soboliphyme baturini]
MCQAPIQPLPYRELAMGGARSASKKNSSSDLHSRLKTRKVLGVGERREDGNVYRSKVSQILGHSDFIDQKLPRGFGLSIDLNLIYFVVLGLLYMCYPQITAFETSFATKANNQYVRLFGAALLVQAFVYHGIVSTNDSCIISIGVLSCCLFYTGTLISDSYDGGDHSLDPLYINASQSTEGEGRTDEWRHGSKIVALG